MTERDNHVKYLAPCLTRGEPSTVEEPSSESFLVDEKVKPKSFRDRTGPSTGKATVIRPDSLKLPRHAGR